ncbi:aldehyde dehydrogenase family protein [Parasphingopyxis marina]|nr:aldehyde dehydrogenase family protein [Parasphingopyxis marina]
MQARSKPIPNYGHLIDGAVSDGEAQMVVISPATEKPVATVPDATRSELRYALAAADKAFASWSETDFAFRRECLFKFAEAVRRNEDEIAEALTREQGKPLAQARGEIAKAMAAVEKFTAIEIEPQIIRDTAEDRIELHYRPLGVVAGITPWNFPVILAAQKIAQALYTGNTMVLKPSPYTPVATLLLGKASIGAIPPGVLNIVSGGNALGAWLTSAPEVRKISFTGSGRTGQAVLKSAAANFARVTLELGGNDAAIVLPDADIDKAVPKIFAAAFNNAGQICMAIKRLYVHADIYHAVVARMAAMADAIQLGDGMDPESDMGPVQNRPQYQKLLGILDHTRRWTEGRIVAGGHVLERPGYFLRPTIVADIAEGSRLVDEEPFGPILPIIRFDDVDDAIRRANASDFGLSGSVWTADTERGAELANRLDVGTAWVNRHGGADAERPFGGAKTSGIGREHGLLGLHSYMEPLSLHVGK